MNQQAYRVIFNKNRSMLMAVSENVSSQGKATGAGCAADVTAAPLHRFATLSLLVAALFGGVTVVQAQMVAYKNGGSGPTIDRSASGRPLVQIVTPNAAGVSHNRYEQYNVDSNGVILNNARTITQTQLGGLVEGNPNLANGSARIILNEVMGGGRSLLNGYTEVAGQRAEVIIANPNGITCSGCGFINTTRGVLTTGTPQFGADGSLEAFRVTRGDIQINGMNASNTAQFDLISRSIQVNGELWANRLNAVTGNNQVNYADLGVTVIQGEGAQPTVGIDVAQLGGMYANKIRLIGTEFGVGVRNLGTMSAHDGDIHLDSRGKVTLNGKTNASGSVAIRSDDDITNSGTLYAQQAVNLNSAGQISNSGTLAAQSNLNLTAASVQSSGVLAAGIDANGQVSQTGNLNLKADGALTATGQNTAGSNVSMTAGSINLRNAQTSAGGSTTLTASDGDIDHTGGNLQTAGSTSINAAGAVVNDRGVINSAQLASSSGSLSNVGGKINADQLTIHATNLANRQGQIAQFGKDASIIDVAGSLDNSNGGLIQTNSADLTLTPQQLNNAGGTISHAGAGQMNVNLGSGALHNQGGSIGSNGSANVTAASIDNRSGSLFGAGRTTVTAISGDIDNSNKGYLAGDSLALKAAGQVNNAAGKIEAIKNGLAIQARSLNNAAGTVQNIGASALDIRLKQGLSNTAANGVGGFIGSAGSIGVNASDIDNTNGTFYSKQDLALNADGTLTNDAGVIQSDGSLSATASAAVSNQAGRVEANGSAATLAIFGSSIDNTSGRIANSGTGATTLQGGASIVNDAGTIGGNGDVTLAASRLSNTQQGQIIAGGDLHLEIANEIDTRQGKLFAARNLRLNQAGATLNNTGGNIGASGDIALSLASLDNSGGQIGNTTGDGGNIALSSSGNVSNAAGNIGSDKNLSINANTITGDGKVIAGQDLTLKLQGDYTNSTGNLLSANRDFSFSTSGTLTNAGNLEAVRNLSLTAANFNNQYGALVNAGNGATVIKAGNSFYNLGRIYGDDVAIGAQSVTNDGVLNADGSSSQAGVIAARNNLDIGAATIVNREYAIMQSLNDMALGGALDADNHVSGNAASILNASATIDAGGDLRLQTAALMNRNDHFSTELQIDPSKTKRVIEYNPDKAPGVWFTADQVTWGDSGDGALVLILPGNWRSERFNKRDYTQIVQQSVVTSSAPGKISSGGNMVLSGTVTNDKSTIIAGGSITGHTGDINNIGATGETITTNHMTKGENYFHTVSGHPHRDHYDYVNGSPDAFDVVLSKIPLALQVWTKQENTKPATDPNQAVGNGVDPNATPSVDGSSLSANGAAGTIGSGSGGSIAPSGSRQTIGTPDAPLPNLVLPNSQLFTIRPQPGQPYLIETDPKFTNYRNFISSDYLLNRLSFDPQKVQKRLGDGFYEQKLINDQIAQLTGKRFLDGYASNEEQYKALMESGVAYAQRFQLTPGIALSAAQMAALTADIVWLVEQEVTLPDGSRTRVLAPVVYLARASVEDIAPTGALISGKNIDLAINGSLSNGGTLQASNKLIVQATDIANSGNIRSTGKDGSTILVAQNDIFNNGGAISGHRVGILAGRDVTMTTAAYSATGVLGTNITLGRIASVNADQLSVQAGRDINLAATAISTTGDTALAAGRDLNLTAVTTQSSYNATYNQDNHLYQSQTQANGSAIDAGGKLALIAGQDINTSAAYVNAGSQLVAAAGRDVNIGSAEQSSSLDQAVYVTSKGMLSSSSDRSQTNLNTTTAIGSTLSGDSVIVQAGRDIGVIGSNIVATNDIDLHAKNNVTIATAQNTSDSSYRFEEKTSGMFSSGGVGVTMGSKSQQNTQTSRQVTNTGSTVGSIDGNVNISAGNTYTQSGSNVIAMQGDVGVTAQKINVIAVHDTYDGKQTSSASQSGLTVGVTAPLINAVQGVQQMASASNKTDDARMKVMAGAAAAGSAYSAVNAAQDPTRGVTISLTVGSSKSNSESTQSGSTVVGSSVKAGGNVIMTATGAGKDSHLNVIGSDVIAGHSAVLKADGDINLGAAQSTDTQHSTSSSSSAAIGIAATYDGKGFAAGITANAAGSRGNSDGTDVTNVNSHVSAGNTLVLSSGHDTNIKGAVASGNQVFANVGASGQGNLNIESLQDTSTYKSKDQAIGGSITIGVGVSGSANYSQSKVDGNYASVGEQSGIKTGDGGFIVNVNGNTDLKGGVIASSDTAVKNNANMLVTQTLTQSDIENHSSYDATGASVGGGYAQQNDKTPGGKSNAGPAGTSVGFGSASGDTHGTSHGGVSGGTIVISDDQKQQQLTGQTATEAVAAVNHDVGVNNAGSVTKDWDGQQLNSQVTAETQIVAAFGQQAAMAIGTYADKQQKALNAEAKQAEDSGDTEQAASLRAEAAKWGEKGDYRVALHTGIGALTGGAAGAAGAFVSAEAMSTIGAAIDNMGLPDGVAKGLAQVTATALGAVVGGGAGAASSLNVEANNRQLHPDERTLAKQLAANSNGKYTVEQVEDALRAADNKRLGEGVGTGSIVNVDGNKATVYDDGAKWSVVQNGKDGTQHLMQQVPLNVSPDLMAYIQQGTDNTYAWSPTQNLALNMNNASGVLNPYKQASCIGTQCSVVMINPQLPTRDQMADGAGWLSTQSGRFAAAATAYGTFLANSPNPILQAGAATQLSMAWTATLVGFGTNALEQALRPNLRVLSWGSLVDYGVKITSEKSPIVGPAITELGEKIKDHNPLERK
ncbi:hemagglutinin repeat-containing protein [Collimonas sp.]|jgi:filamentous hemagglutinin|uniref:hemagglutinin repeat-containing protein n=1 Tax=Collimonas sp. TaxID=1963772 RepID=UPI002D0D0674|nr:hemagglutinin repeat-containing protein [Collimonas sp.]HWW08180.1 hemagglutinin repeat-containing protein [Collimonas sp.]